MPHHSTMPLQQLTEHSPVLENMKFYFAKEGGMLWN